jgi:hypothetical protein
MSENEKETYIGGIESYEGMECVHYRLVSFSRGVYYLIKY